MTVSPRIYEFGAYRLDPTEYRLFHEGEEIRLRKKVMEFLIVLVNHPDQLLSRNQLLDAVWGAEVAVELSNIDVCVRELREALGEGYIETVPRLGFRFKGRVRIVDQPTPNRFCLEDRPSQDRPPYGALPADSPFYIKRNTDSELFLALSRDDMLVLIKGARQVGKSSLLIQGMQYANKQGRRVVVTDLQRLNSDAFISIDKLYYALGELIASQLDIEFPTPTWKATISANMNFEHYLSLEVLTRTGPNFVWCIDEVDRIFGHAYKDDFFGLLRSWHNFPWAPFTIVLAYATEAHLFIADLNQSPFNVGTRLSLQDFTIADVTELDRRYGSPLGGEVTEYFKLLGGHPYLVHYGIYKMARDKIAATTILTQADRDDGLFGDHLHRMFTMLSSDEGLCQAIRALLRGDRQLSVAEFYRLRSAGIVNGDSPRDVVLRCELYAMYLRKHLL